LIGRLKTLFERIDQPGGGQASFPEDGRLAAAALMVEAARLDSGFDEDERRAMRELLARRFGLTSEEAEGLVVAAAEAQARSSGLFRFTHAVKEAFSHEQRVEMIELLWEVVYADGKLHEYEANLLRRVAGLLYVSDRERGEARRRVLLRLGLAD
jgi:uncharacterized tellurite resistance protein B-like protein